MVESFVSYPFFFLNAIKSHNYILVIVTCKTCQLIVLSYLLCYLKVVPRAALALLIHPSMSHNIANLFSWTFCIYLEAVSVLPQLHLIQNTKVNYSMQFH